ncbi:MAG TPA: LysR family transcriptional regulator [Pirellulales bacterium]|jgi:LysR family hydrogen peroxide-inducible transcriptional activator|nr:LysR family transcriptional regulator [Pirellulales bacterium]
MEIHQLRYFLAVADLGSFTRAAEKCLVAQPSLSQQIIKLERELRQPLFDRLGRKVRLTDAGQALYSEAVSILGAVDEIQQRVAVVNDAKQGTVNVGAIPTIAPYLMPLIVKTFQKRFPRAAVALHENLTEFTIRGCLEGEIHVGVIASPPENALLQSELLFTEELLLALPPTHPLLKKRRLALEDIADQPFVLLNEVHCLGEQILGFCKQQGCLPAVRCRSTQLLTVQELVALGGRVSIVPAMARQWDRRRCCEYRSLSDPKPTRTIRMIWHKDRHQSPLVKNFMQMIRHATAKYAKASAALE